MDIVKSRADVRAALRRTDGRIGLAATMGALHEGHVAVVRAARAESDILAASLFVNPMQFEGADDFQSYPRPFDRDMEIFEREGVDVVWAPPVEEVYPEGFGTHVEPGPVSHRLEGDFRPGHFRGVATVVAKLFNVIRPDVSAFGQKDWQQTRVIDALILDLDFDIQMLAVPTVRNSEGLALSSRNRLLNGEQRRAAGIVHKALKSAADAYSSGERDARTLRERVLSTLSTERRCRCEYVSAAHAFTLDELDRAAEPMVISCAARVGAVRLIDNMVFGVDLYGATASSGSST